MFNLKQNQLLCCVIIDKLFSLQNSYGLGSFIPEFFFIEKKILGEMHKISPNIKQRFSIRKYLCQKIFCVQNLRSRKNSGLVIKFKTGRI